MPVPEHLRFEARTQVENQKNLRANSVLVPGPETIALSEVAARLPVGVGIEVNERVQDGPGYGARFNQLPGYLDIAPSKRS